MPVVVVAGAKEAAAATARLIRDLDGPATVGLLLDEAQEIASRARGYAAVDTGRYRDSIVGTARRRGFFAEATVAATAPHAVYAHNGSRPHWPPMRAVAPWARRHGISPFLVARAIARKGTKGDHAIERAFKDAEGRMLAALERGIGRFVAKWGR